MAIYRNAQCHNYYFSVDAASSDPCEVRIGNDGSIAVSYEGDTGPCVYLGREDGDGHYLLTCEEVRGRASLHRFDDGLILEGYWEESGERGMWRIELGEVSDTVSGMGDDLDEIDDDWGDDTPDTLQPDGSEIHAVTLSSGATARLRLPAGTTDGDLLLLAHYLCGLGSEFDL